MLIKKYKKTNCLDGCILFNDDSEYLYWENRKETSDEVEIVEYINQNYHNEQIKILHIGIGNSYISSNIKSYDKIDGITISMNEIVHARKLGIKNYNVFFMNKLSHEAFSKDKFFDYDIIIDVNLKSFSCCLKAFDNLFLNYVTMLKENGKIITGSRGMNWSRMVKPVFSFSFKKFFYKRLKEFNGPEINKLKFDESKELCRKNNLLFQQYKDSSVIAFQKSIK